ncbi:MAG: hypothetical protein HY922_01035 [Elusimicrobia bacterium]|nr:hypothetical protein [Elusimicrobiota bacterium]
MTDKKNKTGGSELAGLFKQLLRHPVALIVLLAQLVFMLTCTYVSGVRKSDADPLKKVGVIVFRRAMLEMPFKSAEKAFYYTLAVDPKGMVIAKPKVTFAQTPLDILRQRIRLAAVVPFSVPAALAAVVFLGLLGFCLCRVLELC